MGINKGSLCLAGSTDGCCRLPTDNLCRTPLAAQGSIAFYPPCSSSITYRCQAGFRWKFLS